MQMMEKAKRRKCRVATLENGEDHLVIECRVWRTMTTEKAGEGSRWYYVEKGPECPVKDFINPGNVAWKRFPLYNPPEGGDQDEV